MFPYFFGKNVSAYEIKIENSVDVEWDSHFSHCDGTF